MGAVGTAPKTSVAAIVSLVAGLLGFCTLGMTGVIGIIFGLVALSATGATGGSRGRGLALGGVAVSVASLATWVIVALQVWPTMTAGLESANAQRDVLHAQQIGQAALVYARDHEGTAPIDDWDQVLVAARYLDVTMLEHPSARGEGRPWAFNARLRGVRLDEVGDPMTTVMLFECAPESPPAGGPELLPAAPRSGRGVVVVYVDGSGEMVPESETADLRWAP